MSSKRIGIIAEFDPFHNGHKYLLDTVKKRFDSSQIIIAMSQDILQRGQFSSFNKWWRARQAVENGADLVLGLPAVVSNSSAEYFARGSIELLKSLDIDVLAFGCESTDLNNLNKIAKILNSEPNEFSQALREELKHGASFPKARETALKKTDSTIKTDLLKNPNSILGIEYLKELENESNIEPFIVQRRGDHYKNPDDSNYLSSTEIRKILKENNGSIATVPYDQKELKENFRETDKDILFQLLIAELIKSTKEDLLEINEINEDIANKLLKIPGNCFNLEEVYFFLKKKNNTYTGISRILSNFVLGIKKSDVLDYYDLTKPYHRVLAFSKAGKEILKESNQKLVNIAKDERALDIFQKQSFEIDKRVLDLRNLVQREEGFKDDYYKKPFVK